MEAEEGEGGEGMAVPGRNRTVAAARRGHIKKRALKNKALSVGFNENDLRDFVTGFHKRKKKRRKIAHKQLQEEERLKRIEARKKRKLEREFALCGGALQVEESAEAAAGHEDDGDDLEPDGLGETQSVSGTKMYENDDMTITVTTSELSREEEDLRPKHHIPKPTGEAEKSVSFLSKKKPLKRVAKQRSHKKPPSRRNGGKRGRKR